MLIGDYQFSPIATIIVSRDGDRYFANTKDYFFAEAVDARFYLYQKRIQASAASADAAAIQQPTRYEDSINLVIWF